MKKVAIVVVAVGALAAVWWFRRSPQPADRPEPAPSVDASIAASRASAGEGDPAPATNPPPIQPTTRVPPPSSTPGAVPLAPREQPTPPAPRERATPVTAAVRLEGHPEWVRRLLEWAGRDPESATAWADGLSDPEQRREALETVCFKIAERDPRAAVDMAETFGLDHDPSVRENLAAQWAAVDASAAVDWALRMPPGDAQEGVVSRVIVVLVASDPREAARLIEGELRPGPTQIEAAASLVQQWWLVDPAAARDWVAGLEEGPLRDRARQELVTVSRRP